MQHTLVRIYRVCKTDVFPLRTALLFQIMSKTVCISEVLIITSLKTDFPLQKLERP